MADPIAEAFVSIRPDLSSFQSELETGVSQAMRRISVPTTAQQSVGRQLFGPGFLQQARTATTQAVGQTQVPTSTQERLAHALFGPGFRNESGRAIQGALVGLGQGELAARFAFFGAGGAAIAAVAGGFAVAVQAAGSFEQSLNQLQAVTQVTDAELAQMSALAKQLGADITLPAVTAQTAADAMTELAKAGLSVNDVMGAVRGTLQLSTAASIDAASAARIVATALNAFKLAGTEAAHVADLLAAASVASQGDIQDLSLALQQSASVAALSGLSLDQLVASLTELANRGLIGSDAGTSLRVALLRLIPTTKEAAQFMEVLGIRIDRTRTLGEQLPDLLDQYQAALARLNPTLRQAVLAQIAGQDAVRSLSFLIQGGGNELERYTTLVNQQGAAQRLAEAKTQGFFGALQGLQSQIQTLAINVGDLFIPALTTLVTAVTSAIKPVNDLAEALGKLGAIKIPSTDFGLGDIATKFLLLSNPITSLPEEVLLAKQALEKLGVQFGATGGKAEVLRHLAEELNKELFKGGVDPARAREIQSELAEIDRQLKGLASTAKESSTQTADAFTTAFGPLAEALRPPLQQVQDLIVNTVDPNDLGQRLQKAIALLNRGDLSDQARDAARGTVSSFIAELGDLGPEGERVLTAIGGRLMRGLGAGITAEEQTAINAAQHALAQVRAEGEQQIQDAIQSARGNLESLGTTLGGELADIFDAGPVPATVRRQIQEVQRSVEQGLRFNLRSAQADLASARVSIASVGTLTPAEQSRQREFLAPFKASVEEAKESLKTFKTDDAISEIDKLAERIQDLQDATQRRQLRFDFSQAKRDLRDAKDSIASVGELTPEQRRAQQDFLAPFREKVKDAKAAADEFNLTKAQEQLKETRDAAVDAADKGIQRLIIKFQNGQVSADEFGALLRRQLGPAFDIVGSKASDALDPFVVINFRREVTSLIAQARALSAFFPLGGATEPGAQVVRPAETQQQVNQRIAESAASLARIEADAKRLSKEEQDKMQSQIGILKQIARALGVGGPAPSGRSPKSTKVGVQGGD